MQGRFARRPYHVGRNGAFRRIMVMSTLDHPGLTALLQQVRRHWRAKRLARGLALALAIMAATFFASAWLLEWLRFSPGAILAGRLVMAATGLAVAWLHFVRPLRHTVSDEQVALYLEEHEPALQAALITAVEAARRTGEEGPNVVSRGFIDRLVEGALERLAASDVDRQIERAQIQRYTAAAGGILVALLLAFSVGPAFLRHAASALFVVSRDVEAASPYRIDVEPGDATLARGADQVLKATLSGFDTETVELVVRRAEGAAFERLPLVRSADGGSFEGILFDVASPTQYFVEASGVRSRLFTLSVVDLPYVERLGLEY